MRIARGDPGLLAEDVRPLRAEYLDLRLLRWLRRQRSTTAHRALRRLPGKGRWIEWFSTQINDLFEPIFSFHTFS